ncbi:MAG: pyroglutamyl-peptidase I [Clostridia bacterium]|nr:pyroglutamyl-peptidase I [Clostridia bacterium]
MKKLLITGFEPFDGESINPSWEAVCRLPDEINGYSLTRLLVPVVFGEGAECVINKTREENFDVVLCIGQAGGRSHITPELVGINLRHARIPDNKENKPIDEPVVANGDRAYFSTLPARKMAEAINAVGVPSQLSYSAGAYVCNEVFYAALAHFDNTNTRVGFIYIPYSKEQNKEPAMDLNVIVKGLVTAIENID